MLRVGVDRLVLYAIRRIAAPLAEEGTYLVNRRSRHTHRVNKHAHFTTTFVGAL